ncbi:MAG: bifunctional precorrin-2 dehydrogenase/sirohydrochlorin ferrochelatase [Deltaproteobacteria bacterium]|jgi:siroheme synthase-like protein|nr:bifunctional precorrin-2 dehydrogenase/sirohydrochlorin ferrochelatase [Deltaproteobacteria bacterium]
MISFGVILGFLTINLNFSHRPALLIGAGGVGRRKLADLLKALAKVMVVEPKPDSYVTELANRGEIFLTGAFDESLLDASPLVFVAIDDPLEAKRLAHIARARGCWVNVVDRPEDCDFYMPAVVDLSPLRLAVTTDGASPALAAHIASELRERYLGHGLLADLMGRLRPWILKAGLSPEDRRTIFVSLAAQPELPKLLAENRIQEARKIIVDLIRPVELPADFLKC